MKQFSISHKWAFLLGTLLTLPVVFVISASLLKYGLHINQPFDGAQPLLEKWGIKESIGFNINAVILFGPLLAIALNAFSLVHFKIKQTEGYYEFWINIKRNWWNIALVIIAGVMLAALFVYMIGENCR